MIDLKNKKVLITGATGGIGGALIKKFISLDTRKSVIMKEGIKNNINLINDVSGFQYDSLIQLMF